MDRVRNLRKTLKKLGKKISEEISSHYTKPKEKQTTKKQDNSSQTKFSQSRLTEPSPNITIVTSSQDTTERITITKMIEEPANYACNWSVDKINELSKTENREDHLNALCICEEFYEWINAEDEIEYYAITDDTWTDEKEIDTK